MWATLIFCGTTALFLSMTLAALWHLRWVRRLPALEALTTMTGSARSSPSERVRCSVVIAARDEETRIEGTVRRLLAQHGVEAEFLIVDDRSTDRTGEILRQLAKEDARVKLKRVEVLPDGWLDPFHSKPRRSNESPFQLESLTLKAMPASLVSLGTGRVMAR